MMLSYTKAIHVIDENSSLSLGLHLRQARGGISPQFISLYWFPLGYTFAQIVPSGWFIGVLEGKFD